MHFCVHSQQINKIITSKNVKVGAERTQIYLPWIKGKNVAVVANRTSMIKNTHLVDSLLNSGIKVKKIFSPEHGFRGNVDAGTSVKNYIDKKTGIPVISLYGNNKKPKECDLQGIDVIVFDIQDVGVRFYTYISTLCYVMEACAENNIPLILLDRPNPNGFYIDGPVLKKKFTSFVGLEPVPIVYGMTIAEYALMVNGEGWLKAQVKCNLKYVKIKNYKHSQLYQLPIKPSPNLPNMKAIYLYPSLALFEGTIVSVGRGTDKPFQIFGNPEIKNTKFSFIPESISGACINPPYKGIRCYGYKLTNFPDSVIINSKKIYLKWLIEMYKRLHNKSDFFNAYFDKLAGDSRLRTQIISGIKEEQIRESWQKDIKKFKKIRKKYLLYP